MSQFEKVVVTGGAGYVGSVLVPKLLESGYEVIVLDLMLYGEATLDDHPRLTRYKGDIRDLKLLRQVLMGKDTVIHLACISNDPSFELNPSLGKSINFDAFEPLVRASREAGVRKFIYASSSSVYGIKEEKNVHEGMVLEPLTDYSIYKARCEEILKKYRSDEFVTNILRPATVYGYSRRQRLDVVVNILTNLAYHRRLITVFGGKQLRPNIHIADMADAYLVVMQAPDDQINGKIYNVGYDNHTVIQLATKVKEVVGEDVTLTFEDTDDNRSYHISSSLIRETLGFQPKRGIRTGVAELVQAFDKGYLPDAMSDDKYVNIKRMQNVELS